MSIAPELPENAPFSAAQRAWLNGFLAGLLSPGTGAAGAGIGAAPSQDMATPAEDDTDFPWHDPALPIEDRLALAAGRRPERVLMAAMAQLDCGQCGYVCQSYAEAIAGGVESNLGRCVPGGKPTSRKLKELLAAGFGNAAPAPVAASVAAPPAAPSPLPGGDKPFKAVFRQALTLNGKGSEKDTRHVVLESEAGDIPYAAGDSVGIAATNCPELVAQIVARLAASPETPVLCPDGIERGLGTALSALCEIRRPSDAAIEVLSSRAHDRGESLILQAMAEGYPGAGPEDADLLDLLDAFPSARPPLSELVAALDPLQPRLYSIASSPRRNAREVHLAVAAVRYRKRGRHRRGVASTYLSDRIAPGEVMQAFIRPSHGFHPPAALDAPAIMIGPGTGIAPFRAFLEDRRATGAPGRNWLFFGNPRRSTDFLFEEELTGYLHDGHLTRLDTAFSRDQDAKLYVQHRILENAPALWSWIEEGAHLYVCGDGQRMAKDVDTGLAYIIAKQGGMDAAAAKAYLARLAKEGRYQRDVY